MKPTRIYNDLLPLLESGLVEGGAHITGGGIIENIPRILPDHLGAIVHTNSWNIPDIFTWIAIHGKY